MPLGSQPRLEWHGAEIGNEIERATIEGMEKVGAEFVRVAHPRTPVWQGFLRRSTRFDPVRRDADGTLVIQMGSFDINYAETQEKGTATRPGKYFYQGSADETWPTLNEHIKDSLKEPAV